MMDRGRPRSGYTRILRLPLLIRGHWREKKQIDDRPVSYTGYFVVLCCIFISNHQNSDDELI